jgi:hypothetical protein
MFILTFVLIFAGISLAQELNVDKYEYLAPLPGSSNVNPYTNIIIRKGPILNESDILNTNILKVTGSKSGVHKGKTLLLENSKTILFKPFNKFHEYELVTVELNYGKYNNKINILPQLEFNFTTGKDNSHIAVTEFCDLADNEKLEPDANIEIGSSLAIPELSVNTYNNPSDDYLFLGLSSGGTGHILIVDNDLVSVFYRKLPGVIFHLNYQPTNEITYNIYPVYSYGMDNSGNRTRQFFTPTGYALDIHDLQVMEDSSYYILGREFLTIDMSKYVINGDTAAILNSHTIHQMDVNNNEIWQWRAIDHYDILDVDEYVNLRQHSIDWTHCNAIEVDYDGNILLSTRNFNEITKIDRRTGDIIWRFGGEKNQFRSIAAGRGFSRQHDVRRLANGTLAFFNNGNKLNPEFSSFNVYRLDEENFHATLIKQYSRNPSVFSNSRGSVQELDNGNTLICWGPNQAPAITEINSYDFTEFEIDFITYAHQSHAYRHKWRTNLFSIKSDTIDFGFVNVGDSSSQSIRLYNRIGDDVIINEVLSSSTNFILKDTLPLIVPSRDEISLNLMFKPNSTGYFIDKLNIRHVNDTMLLGQQAVIIGKSVSISSVEGDYSLFSYSLSQNYPNPFNPSTKIRYSIPFQSNVEVIVYNSIGESIAELVDKLQSSGTYEVNWDAGKIASGIYFYSIKAIPSDGTKPFTFVRKMILLK